MSLNLRFLFCKVRKITSLFWEWSARKRLSTGACSVNTQRMSVSLKQWGAVLPVLQSRLRTRKLCSSGPCSQSAHISAWAEGPHHESSLGDSPCSQGSAPRLQPVQLVCWCFSTGMGTDTSWELQNIDAWAFVSDFIDTQFSLEIGSVKKLSH